MQQTGQNGHSGNYDYDMIVIGAGSAGLVAATIGARFDAKTLLVEKNRLGGDCTWTGCVPSKSLLHVAKVAHAARKGAKYGIMTEPPKVNMAKVRDYVHSQRNHVYQHETPEVMQERGMDVLIGEAKFVDAHTIRVGDQTVTGKSFILTTGARPSTPPISGIENVKHWNYENIFDNDVLPERLIVIGAGPIGMEMAQAHQRLGAQVTVIDRGVLIKDEPEAGETLRRVLEGEGVKFVRDFCTELHQEGDEIVAMVGETEVRGDMLLIAVGRVANVEGLDLENAGIKFSKKGIEVDDNLRTNVPHIYSAGDSTGGPQFTHYAGWQGYIAARNALLPGSSTGIAKVLPWTTFTEPEVAHVGMLESEAKEKFGESNIATTVKHNDTIDRAITEDDLDGFIKLVHKTDGTIVGATIVANRAGEMITEYIHLLNGSLKARDISGAIHVYPSYSDGVKAATSALLTANLFDGFTGNLIKTVSRLTR